MSNLEKLEIFVVDDEPLILKTLFNILSKRCKTVSTFDSAEKALEAFKIHKPHFILSDIKMPYMNGIEFCKKIKEIDSKMIVAFLSATDDREHLIEAINAGTDYFLAKPIETQKLNELLDKIFDRLLADQAAKKQQSFLENELKIKNRSLLEQSAILDQIRRAISQNFLFRQISKDGKLLFANDNFKSLFGLKSLDDIDAFNNRYFKLQNEEIDLAGLLAEDELQQRTRCYKSNNKTLILKSTVVPIPSTDDLIEISCDVTEAHELAQKLANIQEKIVFTLGNIVESRSEETYKHVERVANYSALIASRYGIKSTEVALIKAASPLHDIGKIAIDDAILKKPAKLTTDEIKKMQTHTTIGYDLLKNAEGEVFEIASKIALNHHERWDGNGYPNRLKKDEIDLYARIVSIADVFDAISSKRVYKDAWSFDEAVDYILSQSALAFDPDLVRSFELEISNIKEIKESL